jgi:ABC-2 type transport system ATP-binding protein
MKIGLGALVALVLLAGAGPAAAESYSVQTLHIDVVVGPQHNQPCAIVGDLYRPADATVAHPDPAVLTTNGFAGSKQDQAPLAQELASDGYVVLAYSGLGFGASGCPIEFDDPAWDGEAASQLITFLGGGSAATNGVRVDYVTHDAVAHNGVHYADDPRVGMVGASYGGEVQFAAADEDPRLDAIIPLITWNDLSYSLAPNNASPTGDGITNAVPGVAKFEWINVLGVDGFDDGLGYAAVDPMRELSGCPNFNPGVCQAFLDLDATGYPDPSALGLLRRVSVESYVHGIRIPTMLMQGEADTLFNLNEAVATYAALRQQGTPVKLVWQSWGHAQYRPAPGEMGVGESLDNPGGTLSLEGRMIVEWFNHYLKGSSLAPPLNFSFFRPWIDYPGDDASAAYASAPRYPIGTSESFDLSGDDSLVAAGSVLAAGAQSFLTPPAGVPTSTTEISGVTQAVPLLDLPGTYAEYESAPLARSTDVVGIPTVRLRISAPVTGLTGAAGPIGELALFFKLDDIAPDGTRTLPSRLISPARFVSSSGDITVALPGIVHRFAAGDRLALIVAGGDAAYRGGNVPTPVTISTDPADPGVLTLPVAGSRAYGPVAFASVPRRTRHKSRRRHRRRSVRSTPARSGPASSP